MKTKDDFVMKVMNEETINVSYHESSPGTIMGHKDKFIMHTAVYQHTKLWPLDLWI